MGAGLSTNDRQWPLLAGERLLWSGCPSQGWLLSGSDFFLIPFSLLWCALAIFWETAVLRAHAPLVMRIWGVPFVLIGVFAVVGRFALDAWLRGRTQYAVTTLRVLIARSAPWHSLTALSLDRLPEVQLMRRADGRGTLRFGQPATSSFGWGSRGSLGRWLPALDPTPQFLAVDDAQGVFDQIQRAIRLQG